RSASGRLRATRLHSSTHQVRSWAQSVAEKFGCSAELRGAPAEGCVPLDCIPRLITCAPGRSLLPRSSAVRPNSWERQREVACHSTAFLDSSRALLGAGCCGEVCTFLRRSRSASGRLRATRLHSSTHQARSWAQSVAEKFGCSAELRGAPAEGCV